MSSATTVAGQRSALLGGRAASSHVPAATTGDGQRRTRLGGWKAPDSADEQQRRGSFSRGGRNSKRINRYTPVGFSLFDAVCSWRLDVLLSYLPGRFPHVVRALPWLAARAVILPLVPERAPEVCATASGKWR